MAKINAELLKLSLDWRYATRFFDPAKQISDEDLNTLLHSMNFAPTSYGLQPFHFVIVENRDVRRKLKAASWNQNQITDSSHLIVLATLKQIKAEHVESYLERIVKVRGISREKLKSFEAMLMKELVIGPFSQAIHPWTQKQAYISMGFLMMTAALLKIDSCPMEGLEPGKYDEILGLMGGDYSTVAAIAIGYRSDEDPLLKSKKVRMTHEELYRFVK